MKSVVTKYEDMCFFCRRKATQNHHLVFGSGNRTKAEEYGLKVPICAACHTTGNLYSRIHDNPMAEKLSKMLGQAIFERELALSGADKENCRQSFIREFGESYL